jgi:hypothetical protein
LKNHFVLYNVYGIKRADDCKVVAFFYYIEKNLQLSCTEFHEGKTGDDAVIAAVPLSPALHLSALRDCAHLFY